MGSGTKLPKLLTDCRQTKGQMLNGHHLLPAKWKTFRYKPNIPFNNSRDESIISSCYWLKKNVTFLTLEFGQYGVPRLVRILHPVKVMLQLSCGPQVGLARHCAATALPPAVRTHAACTLPRKALSVKSTSFPSNPAVSQAGPLDHSTPQLTSGYQRN